MKRPVRNGRACVVVILAATVGILSGSACRTAPEARVPCDDCAAAESHVRRAFADALRQYASEPGAGATFAQTHDYRAAAATGGDVITVFIQDYALDIPRSLFQSLRNPWLFVRAGGWTLRGNCRLTMLIEPELGLPDVLRDTARNFDLHAEGLGEAADLCPGYGAQLRDQIRARLDFATELDVLRAAFARDHGPLANGDATPAELYVAAALTTLKPTLLPLGHDAPLARVLTNRYAGVLYGDPTTSEFVRLDLHTAERQIVRLTLACLPHHDADRAAVLPAWPQMVASVRPHGSATPGQDLLANAIAILAKSPNEDSRAIARSLVLCASRYPDAHAQAVELGETLADSGVIDARAYLDVLHLPPLTPQDPA